ncbi:response regulator [Neorhizobium galegae]|uniref:response regulator n=1 Tax=Neorhizobium galegae TaxID=399 RepID=UPI0006223B89|nr:response regulator [Neorhizobium galegae]CDZ28839.1 Putative contains a 2-component receiver domain protein [Neorhizobium galegae bv. officinalis]KAA9386083.1 response regulator [Neorhizobium galegae]MCM2496436.1 response regulator [Neorhizobium galegae]MCQ1770428.1 response regulator [Neorhizobium galegae]MCQ1777333.1 response regulator [Neorhizobium galegae]
MNDLASADANIQAVMLEVISEGISGGVFVYDKNDLIVFASQQLLTLLPVPKSFLAPGTRLRDFLGAVYDGGGRFLTDVSGPRRMLSREDWVAEQIATLWKERAESQERRGTDRWLSFTKRRLSSGYGVCVVRDISDHKKREEQWRADMERVQITEEVLDNLPFPITVKDSSLTFVAVNKMAANFLDLPPEAILGHKGSDIHPPQVEQRLDRINRGVLDLGEPQQMSELVTRPDGSQVVIIANKYRIGKPGRYYLVTAMEDITGLVATDEDGEQIKPRMSRGGLITTSLARQEHNVPATVTVASDTTPLSNRKVLVASSDPRTSAEALEILDDLGFDTSSVSDGEELELFLQLAKEASIAIDLVVVDTLADKACLEIVQRHRIPALAINGVRVKRELAAGVTRQFSQPATHETAGDEDTRIVSQTGESDGIDILVAEDNEVNQIVFSQILEGLGYRYVIAADGEEAVRLWQERSPRLILMDITLPKLSGFDASVRIRNLETIDNSIPIIGVLPQAFERDRDQCFASGMNEVILKPISPEALEAVFQTFLGISAKRSYA